MGSSASEQCVPEEILEENTVRLSTGPQTSRAIDLDDPLPSMSVAVTNGSPEKRRSFGESEKRRLFGEKPVDERKPIKGPFAPCACVDDRDHSRDDGTNAVNKIPPWVCPSSVSPSSEALELLLARARTCLDNETGASFTPLVEEIRQLERTVLNLNDENISLRLRFPQATEPIPIDGGAIDGALPQRPPQDELGIYRLLSGVIVKAGFERNTKEVTELFPPKVVIVLEIRETEDRVRARIEEPPGWISIVDKVAGVRSAEKVIEEPDEKSFGAEKSMASDNIVYDSEKQSTKFKIHLEKKQGDVVGVDVDWRQMDKLKITKVRKGLVMAWNTRNPDQALNPGDYIIDVNGTDGNCKDILDAVRRYEVLDMTIERRPA